MNRFNSLFKSEKPIIGMIHLPPLPEYADSPGLDAIIESAIRDMEILERHGIDGALIENEYDRPHRVKATQETIATMTTVAKAVVQSAKNTIVGVEILLNDPIASLNVAKAAGASFIRTDYFVDPMSRPEYGEFEIDPEAILNHRNKISAKDILILADIQVKYATMLVERTIAESASLAQLHGADAVVVSGRETGDAPITEDLDAAKGGCDIPVIIGSGTDAANVATLLAHCNGAIVGTALMKDKCVNAENAQKLKSAIGKNS